MDEREALAEQLREAWEAEIAAAGFVLVAAPSEGIAGAYHWTLAGFPGQSSIEGSDPQVLLAAAEGRLDRGRSDGPQRQRTPSRVALLREVVQRLARLQTIDWRLALDAQVRGIGNEERRAALWAAVTRRALPPRLD